MPAHYTGTIAALSLVSALTGCAAATGSDRESGRMLMVVGAIGLVLAAFLGLVAKG